MAARACHRLFSASPSGLNRISGRRSIDNFGASGPAGGTSWLCLIPGGQTQPLPGQISPGRRKTRDKDPEGRHNNAVHKRMSDLKVDGTRASHPGFPQYRGFSHRLLNNRQIAVGGQASSRSPIALANRCKGPWQSQLCRFQTGFALDCCDNAAISVPWVSKSMS